jgi:hypothetical protein
MQVYDKKIIICDIDGTIANLQHRLHYIKNADGTKKKYKDADWDSFHKACVDDTPINWVIRILANIYGAYKGSQIEEATEVEVFFFSGRNESVRQETLDWLWKHVLSSSMCHSVEITKEEYEHAIAIGLGHTVHEFGEDPTNVQWPQGYVQLQPNLEMRSEGDRRPDTQVKFEMLYEYKMMPEDVLCILDDRQSVVDMWRENGFNVMQVDAWKEPAPVHHLTQEKLESLNKAELIFLIEHERKYREMGWRDTLRTHLEEAAKNYDLSNWRQKKDPKDTH